MQPSREFPAKVKRQAFERCKDLAGVPRCESCTAALGPGNINYDDRLDGECDHDLADGLGGEPVLANCVVRCKTCHRKKTRVDRRLIAKGKRVSERHFGMRPVPRQVIFGSRASGYRKPMNGGAPIVRATGRPLFQPRPR